jgi:hypothetical protein
MKNTQCKCTAFFLICNSRGQLLPTFNRLPQHFTNFNASSRPHHPRFHSLMLRVCEEKFTPSLIRVRLSVA